MYTIAKRLTRLGHLAALPMLGALIFSCSDNGGGGGAHDTAAGLDGASDRLAVEVVEDATREAPDVQDSTGDILGETEPADGGDAGPVDAYQPDSEECPAPPSGPWAGLCAVDCGDDSDCSGKGARCLTFQDSGQMFCALPCAEGEPSWCPEGYACYDVDGEQLCAPLAGDCHIASAGISCNGEELAGLCKYDFPVCTSNDWRPGYCTRGCEVDSDCPGEFGTCTDGGEACAEPACRAVWEEGPQGCGVAAGDDAGDGAPCRDDADCPDGKTCLTAPSVSPGTGFCSVECAGDGECAENAVCAELQGALHCLPPQCSCLADRETLYDQLLAELGLSRCNAGFHRDWLNIFPGALSHDPWRLKYFHQVHDYPPSGLQTVQKDVAELDEETGQQRVAAAIAQGARMLDRPVPATPTPTLDSPALAEALALFIESAGGAADVSGLEATLADLPPDLADPLIPIVDRMTQALLVRQQIAGAISDQSIPEHLFLRGHGFVAIPKDKFVLSPASDAVYKALTAEIDLSLLFTAGHELAQAVADSGLPSGSMSGPPVIIETPAGLVIFGGDGDDVYDGKELGTDLIALLVDTGGNDTYRVPAGATAAYDNPVSVLLDFGGNDDYGYHDAGEQIHPMVPPEDEDGRYVPKGEPGEDNGPFSLSDRGRQGSGRFGYGLLYDFGDGADSYTSLRISQGAGVFGVGVLFDEGGDDVYMSEALAQGAAVFGIGVLMDEQGTDLYSTAHVAQGFAYARAYGLLYDADGDDEYASLLGDPELGGMMLYLNPQNPGKSNTSMTQGFGFGRRADFTDQIFMSGGGGMLRDVAGNDSYMCDIFGLGTGYWFGTGIVADGSGADHYDGRWYVIGASAHMANGILIDAAGDDVYNESLPLLNCSVGCGHDFSLGLLADLGGDDTYNAPSLAVGAGNADGIGILLDTEGDDSYSSTANNTFGFANSADYGTLPETLKCIGLFLDSDGTDTYFRPDLDSVPIGDNSLWLNPPAHEGMGNIEKGGGIDGNDDAGFTP